LEIALIHPGKLVVRKRVGKIAAIDHVNESVICDPFFENFIQMGFGMESDVEFCGPVLKSVKQFCGNGRNE
jgi:hypothetical protein